MRLDQTPKSFKYHTNAKNIYNGANTQVKMTLRKLFSRRILASYYLINHTFKLLPKWRTIFIFSKTFYTPNANKEMR